MTTHNEALSDYRRFRARQAGVAADTPPGRLGPDPEHAAALTHASMLLVPSYRREQQKQRAAAAEAERRAGMPEPREVLREAHRMRAEAQAEADRLHSSRASAPAQHHWPRLFGARDAAKRASSRPSRPSDTRKAARRRCRPEDHPAGSSPVAGEKRVALADAEHQVEIASRAVDKLAGDLAAAQQRLEAAARAVTGAVCAVLLSEAERQAVEILREVEALDDKRRALDGLAVEISNRQRTGGPARPVWPPQIREALFAPAAGAGAYAVPGRDGRRRKHGAALERGCGSLGR